MEYYSSYVRMNTPRTAYPDVLKRIAALKEEHNVSPNVSSFLSSISASYKKHGGITKKQYEAFCDIERNYNESHNNGDINWVENYSDEKKEIAEICALYYCENPPYYGDLAYRILYDKEFIPSEKQYNSITGNKYSTKVLQSHFAPPRFQVNDYVSLRKNSPHNLSTKNNIFIIIQINPEPITTAAKNTKKYKILPIEGTSTHIVEERWLKFSSKK